MRKEVIYIGADHAGFELKEKIKRYFDAKKVRYEDLGGKGEEKDDYPDFAFAVGKEVVREKGKGILICGTGEGMCISANKVKGARAAVVFDEYSAKMAREHNDANIICLRGRKFSDRKAIKLVKIFLENKFANDERHKRRIRKIEKYERGK